MTRCIELAEYLWLAEQVTRVEAAVLIKAVDIGDRQHDEFEFEVITSTSTILVW